MSYLTIEDLSLVLGKVIVLRDISLEIESGETVALIGPNGAGKSSLIKCILGIFPYSGKITYRGKSLKHPRELKSFLKRVGYVPQFIDFDRESPITVRELLTASLPKEVSGEALLSSVKEVGAEAYLDHRLGALSGGQLQRIMIALNLLKDPELMLLDEPSSGIDIHGQEVFYSLLRRIQKERNLTVVLVSHDIGVVHNVASRVLCVNQTLQCSGPPQLVLTPEKIKELYDTDSSLYIHHHHHPEEKKP